MTALLASVRDQPEAERAVTGGVDILDLKEPANGALGAVPLSVIRAVAAWVAGRVPISATIGDEPLERGALLHAVQARVDAGADIIKVPVLTGDAERVTLDAVATLAAKDIKLVAVCFAELGVPSCTQIRKFSRGGFFGVMLDTADKTRGSLRLQLDLAALADFVSACRAAQLRSGLAGSLTVSDIAPLRALAPDYLGFRGALCAAHNRKGTLDARALAEVRNQLLPTPGVTLAWQRSSDPKTRNLPAKIYRNLA